MSKKMILLSLLGIFMNSCSTFSSKETAPTHAPQIVTKLEKHGHVREDEYFWMRDRQNPEVIKFLNEENARFEKVMKPLQKVQTALFEEMKSRILENDESVPAKRGNYWYSRKYVTGAQYPIYLRRFGSAQGTEQILIDVNQLAQGKSYTHCTGPVMDDSQMLMLYACDHTGRRFYSVFGKDTRSGNDLQIDLPNVTSNIVWAADGKNFFYVRQDPETLRSYQVWRYNILTHKKVLVYEEKDTTYSLYLNKSEAEKYIFLTIASTLTTEVRFLDRKKPLTAFEIFHPRERGHEYSVFDGADRFYVLTNWNAKDFRLMEVPLQRRDKQEWKEVIPQTPGELITGVIVLMNRIVVESQSKGLNLIAVYNRVNFKKTSLSFPENAYVAGAIPPLEYNASHFRFSYESMAKPETIYEWDFLTQKQAVLKIKQVPGFDPAKYKTERVWITTRDGIQIPVSLLMPAQHQKNSSAPLLVYGYGSYGMSMSPWFMSNILSLVDRGWVFAMTHIRGGSELGREHYENGRQMKKMNTFYDFIDSTEALIKLGYANPKRVYAQGGSAGGLLMGAVMNLKPELYQGIIAEVPFVDVISTMLDESIPLTTGEYDEWGNPNEKEAYEYILKYSPYDNLRKGPYPHVLAMTGFHDSQVQYWEPAKWIARLSHLKTNKTLTLLRTDMSSGHSGASGRFEEIKDVSLWMTFLLLIDEKASR